MKTTTDQVAERIVSILRATYVPHHELAVVDCREFGHLDLAFYDAATDLLTSLGYRVLGDLENRTLNSNPKRAFCRIMIRGLVSPDGSVSVGIYHAKRRARHRFLSWIAGHPKHDRIVDVETEYADGSFLLTTNATSASLALFPPTVRTQFVPYGTEITEILATHHRRHAALLASEPGCTPRIRRTLEEVLESQRRQLALKCAFRDSIGGLTVSELQRIAGNDSVRVAEIAERVRELWQDRPE